MNDLSQLKPKLSVSNYQAFWKTLEQRIAKAMEEKWEYSQFLLNLLTDEVIRRDNRQLTLRVGRSGLNPEKTIASFDFSFNKHIHKPTIRELATCSFIEQRRNLFFVGPSGVGKSHLSQALGNEASLKNIDVMYRGTHELLKWINAGRADGIRTSIRKDWSGPRQSTARMRCFWNRSANIVNAYFPNYHSGKKKS
jgi:DNA replication protein DnaC